MSLITHILNQSCGIMTTLLNKYGEQECQSSNNIKCRFREITGIEKMTNREEFSCDAILWVEPNQLITDGQIISIYGKFYRVNKIVVARRLVGNAVFNKCLLDVYHDVEEAS